MAQTLVALLVHVVFSTKNRANLIAPDVETELYSYVGGILRERGSRLIAAGGTSNHVHLLISLSKNDALPAMQELKKSTSKWIKTRDGCSADFQWQEGYGAFTIGASQIPVLRTTSLARFSRGEPIGHRLEHLPGDLRTRLDERPEHEDR